MDLRVYQENAKRTMNWDLENNIQLSAMTLGIAGELGEVFELVECPFETDQEVQKVKDEAGDVFWYVANKCTLLSLDWRTLFPPEVKGKSVYRDIVRAMRHASNLADTVKKTIAQRHVLDIDKVVEALRGIIACLTSVLSYYGLTPQEVCSFNQQKLMKRYPSGFSADRSINREE